MPRRAASPLAVAAVFLLVRATPAAADAVLLPGRMGFNALPALPNLDPVVGTSTELELGAAAQASGIDGRDSALTPTFRLAVPFAGVAAVDLDGAPVEVWRTSAQTQARLGARDRGGVAQGDIRFGGRFLVVREGAFRPAFGVRFAVKTTTGKSVSSYRFTDAPAYLVDALLGKDLGAIGPVRLRALAKLGFLAWQVEPAGQDDAIDYGATLRAAIDEGALSVEWRGYSGWRGQDHPEVVGATAALFAGRSTEIRATVNRGITRDAPPMEVRLGVVVRIGEGERPEHAREPLPWFAAAPAKRAEHSAPAAPAGGTALDGADPPAAAGGTALGGADPAAAGAIAPEPASIAAPACPASAPPASDAPANAAAPLAPPPAAAAPATASPLAGAEHSS